MLALNRGGLGRGKLERRVLKIFWGLKGRKAERWELKECTLELRRVIRCVRDLWSNLRVHFGS